MRTRTHSLALIVAALVLVSHGSAGDPKIVAEQKAAALANWKKVFEKADPPHEETEHFLLFGTVPGKTFKEVGAMLEKGRELAWKVLELEKDKPWQGKMVVYLVGDRREYRNTVRGIERRQIEEGERGSHAFRSDKPHVIAGHGTEAYELKNDAQAVAQVAISLLLSKIGDTVPEWVQEGFGRATALHVGPAEALAAERRRAFAVAVTGKRKAQDAWGSGELKEEEAPVLRASVIDYLAYSGKTKVFPLFLNGFRPQEGQPNPNAEAALKSANVAPARLQEVWLKYVRSLK